MPTLQSGRMPKGLHLNCPSPQILVGPPSLNSLSICGECRWNYKRRVAGNQPGANTQSVLATHDRRTLSSPQLGGHLPKGPPYTKPVSSLSSPRLFPSHVTNARRITFGRRFNSCHVTGLSAGMPCSSAVERMFRNSSSSRLLFFSHNNSFMRRMPVKLHVTDIRVAGSSPAGSTLRAGSSVGRAGTFHQNLVAAPFDKHYGTNRF